MFRQIQQIQLTGRFTSTCLRDKGHNLGHSDCLSTGVTKAQAHVHGFHVLRLGHIDSHVRKLFCVPDKTCVVVKYGKETLTSNNVVQWSTSISAKTRKKSIVYVASIFGNGRYEGGSLWVKPNTSDVFAECGSCIPPNMLHIVLYKWRAYVENITVCPKVHVSIGYMRRILPTLLRALVCGDVSLEWEQCRWYVPALRRATVVVAFHGVYLLYFGENIFTTHVDPFLDLEHNKVVTCCPETALSALIKVATTLHDNIDFVTAKCEIVCLEAHWSQE